MEKQVVCSCGKKVESNDADIINTTTEMGEEYHEVELECSCGNKLKWDNWGDCRSESQFIDSFDDYIDRNPGETKFKLIN